MISDNQQIETVLQTLPFLNSDDAFKRNFLQHASIAKIENQQHVCLEGGTCSHLALILEGSARVYKLGENGREITLYRIGKGQSCILTTSCILSNQPFPAYAICETDVTGVVISANQVKQWLSEFSTWRDYVFSLVAHRLSNIISIVEEVAFRRMDSRIAQYLVDSLQGNSVIETTHQIIASDLGTSREVVSRILKDLEQNMLIQITRGKITVLDQDKLLIKSALR